MCSVLSLELRLTHRGLKFQNVDLVVSYMKPKIEADSKREYSIELKLFMSCMKRKTEAESYSEE